MLGPGTMRLSPEMSLWSYCESVMTEGPERGWWYSSAPQSVCERSRRQSERAGWGRGLNEGARKREKREEE